MYFIKKQRETVSFPLLVIFQHMEKMRTNKSFVIIDA